MPARLMSKPVGVKFGRGADVDLGAIMSGDDPDAGLLEPNAVLPDRVCDGRGFVVEA